MAKTAKRFVFTLTGDEAAIIKEAAGEGGHQELQRRLTEQLSDGKLEVDFDDTQMGELIRYMTQYGSGGFQGRLYKAFIRSVQEQLGL